MQYTYKHKLKIILYMYILGAASVRYQLPSLPPHQPPVELLGSSGLLRSIFSWPPHLRQVGAVAAARFLALHAVNPTLGSAKSYQL